MESECENTRRWLLQAERYEDVAKFDASVEARERFCKERGSYHCHDNVTVMEPEIQKDTKEQKHMRYLEETINAKDNIIKSQEQRLRDKDAIISFLKGLLDR